MSAAATRAEKLEHRTDELRQPAQTCIPGNQETSAGSEVARVTDTNLASISNHGTTPLMRAACDGLAGTVRAQLDRGAEVNAKRSDGFNALTLAAFFGHSQVVWLLLENGADLAATGRSETPPERWADARGFFEIGDALRETRVTEQLEVSAPSTGVIDESARFSRPTENEKHQRVDDPTVGVETTEIDESSGSEATLVMKPAPSAAESTATISESTVDIFWIDKPEHAQQEPVSEQPLRAVKLLPEIEDSPPLVVPKFHPGSAFVARITSSRQSLAALILAVLLGGSGIVAFMFPQIRKSLAEAGTKTVSDTTNLPADLSHPVADSRTIVSGTAPVSDTANLPADSSHPVADSGTMVSGTAETPSAPATRPTSAVVSQDIENPANSFAAETAVSHSSTNTRKHRTVSRTAKFKQQAVPEEEPKPAPLTVETSRSRTVISTPDGSASEVPRSQSPPQSIISGKPKSKVIQWP